MRLLDLLDIAAHYSKLTPKQRGLVADLAYWAQWSEENLASGLAEIDSADSEAIAQFMADVRTISQELQSELIDSVDLIEGAIDALK